MVNIVIWMARSFNVAKIHCGLKHCHLTFNKELNIVNGVEALHLPWPICVSTTSTVTKYLPACLWNEANFASNFKFNYLLLQEITKILTFSLTVTLMLLEISPCFTSS